MIRAHHLGMAARFLAHRFRALHPFDVQASLLNACNLRCVYCRCPDVKIDLMTTQQWCQIIQRLAAVGTMRIKFQGGEPTLRRDFCEISAVAHGAGMVTAVVTNGLEIPKRPAVLDHLDEAVFSLDAASPALHDRLRGQGTHARVVEAIDLTIARGLRVYLAMVVTRENLTELEPMLAFCEARGIRMHAQPVLFDRQYYDGTVRHLGLTDDEMRSMHRRLADWKRQGRALIFAAPTYEDALRWPDYTVMTTRSDGESPCMAGKFYIHIEPNGDVLPCKLHGARFTPKNLLTDGFEAALRHAQHHDCGDCFATFLTERKDLFGLKPAALLELIRRA